ncbi:type III-A CRISPR-associated RAMP protein Csm5 [Clostridiaceae bacterium UIB06]|uniref:CRISPR system Cms protein Csm5 n=1 Tax=Clostridium thailandense TaxID=2794346 RepID=A0A949U275_9CLOT|nr:type III-A CRISPR-associated RAMP protein Csm5 [Clostridium thailandense]MBV7275128.1 type III-A CRISPR-associated RAMP protein Csm5 [Clostridium thailandense]MCH5136915.1 type III-A CRISPR-associated RAMP protein Csm5 [Clostridiaceae bacterium UIB06]
MEHLQKDILNLEIKTLSPVAILDDSNSKLSPYIDIVKDKDDFILLDIDKISDILIKDEEYYNKYLQILRNNRSNSRDKYTIRNLLQDKHIKLEEVEAGRIKCGCNIKGNVEINTCIKSKGIPYIPGSSLKGCIRTAILYNKIDKNDIVGKKTIFTREYIGQDIFRKNPKSVQEDIFKNLIIRDTEIDSNIQTSIYEARSINIYKDINSEKLNLDMKILLECIDKKQTLNSQIVLKGNDFTKEDLFYKINDFYEKVVNKELEEICKVRFNEKDILINEYNLLLEKIKKFKKDKNGFIARVGKLKGFFSNTLAAELSDNEIYSLVIDQKKKRKKGEFPTTKWVISSDNDIRGTFGWIEVKEI